MTPATTAAFDSATTPDYARDTVASIGRQRPLVPRSGPRPPRRRPLGPQPGPALAHPALRRVAHRSPETGGGNAAGGASPLAEHAAAAANLAVESAVADAEARGDLGGGGGGGGGDLDAAPVSPVGANLIEPVVFHCVVCLPYVPCVPCRVCSSFHTSACDR